MFLCLLSEPCAVFSVEKQTDLERSRSCRRSERCRFSVQPPERDLQLPRSVRLDPDWLLTSSSSGLRTHRQQRSHNNVSEILPARTDKKQTALFVLTFHFLLLLLLLLGLSGEAGGQVYAGGSGGGGDGWRRLIHSFGNLWHRSKNPCRAERKTNTSENSKRNDRLICVKETSQSGVTKFRRADEVADAAHAAVVLSLRLVELHADPLTAGELCSPTEPQSAGLRDKALRLRVAQTQDSKLKTSHSLHFEVVCCIWLALTILPDPPWPQLSSLFVPLTFMSSSNTRSPSFSPREDSIRFPGMLS